MVGFAGLGLEPVELRDLGLYQSITWASPSQRNRAPGRSAREKGQERAGVAGWPERHGKGGRKVSGSGADETSLHAQSQGRCVAVLGRVLRIYDAALEPRDE